MILFIFTQPSKSTSPRRLEAAREGSNMRARTTWNREQIKQATAGKTAEDPRAMNQDHHSQQPSADAYVNGDPSSWAEDVHKPNTWDVEYSGGATKRDEIGMPEKRPETYTHPEKTAAMEEKRLSKKAEFTVKLAKLMLGSSAPEAAVEDQAVALMHMPDEALITTYNTLSEKLADQSQFPGGQYPTAEQQAQAQQQQIAQLQHQAQQALQDGNFEQAKMAIEQCMAQQQQKGPQQQQVMAGQKKADGTAGPAASPPAPQAPAPATAAPAATTPPATTAPAPGAVSAPDVQAIVQQAINAAFKQAGLLRANDQQQDKQDQQGQQQQASLQGQMPGQLSQVQQQADDALLDELMMGPGQGGMSESDIELEAPSMDTGEVVLGPEDDVLKTLFANEETQQAEQAQQAQQDQGDQKQAGMGRTASTRTVGTRPTGGVSRVGGTAGAPIQGARGTGEIDKLAALWPSAPDVRGAFNMNS